MKALLIIIILGIGGYFGYQHFFNTPDTVKITGNIQVSQRGNFDINAPQVSGPLFIATVNGTAKNLGKKPLKNVFIKYKVAGENTSAMIFTLGPGEQISFTTNSVKTRGKNPPFNLENVEFEESD